MRHQVWSWRVTPYGIVYCQRPLAVVCMDNVGLRVTRHAMTFEGALIGASFGRLWQILHMENQLKTQVGTQGCKNTNPAPSSPWCARMHARVCMRACTHTHTCTHTHGQFSSETDVQGSHSNLKTNSRTLPGLTYHHFQDIQCHWWRSC